MLTSINVKFILDSALLGLFSSANIPQIADVALWVGFLPFRAMFLAIISPSVYSWNEWTARHFCFHNQNNSTSSPGLSVNGALTYKEAALLTLSVH